jgi:hypothetical protein
MCPRQGSNFLSLPRKKVTKERGTRRWRSACGRLLCGARSLGPAPNSLRGLWPLRSDKRREVRLRSALTRAAPKPCAPRRHPRGPRAIQVVASQLPSTSLRIGRERSDASSSRCEASRVWCSSPPSDELSSTGLCSCVRSTLRNLPSRRLSEWRERSEQSEFGASCKDRAARGSPCAARAESAGVASLPTFLSIQESRSPAGATSRRGLTQ